MHTPEAVRQSLLEGEVKALDLTGARPEVDLGFGRIVALEREAPNMLVNMV